jgi:cyanophycinase-like exopeptidase
MKTLIYSTIIFCFCDFINAQNFTSFFTGNTSDVTTNPLGGVCLMGGATENDEAMKWFLSRASGGDVLVLRTSGSDGYNNYFFSELGVQVNSVETIRFNSPQASSNPYILDKISKAEAIWFAGGNQWDYVSYWRNTEIANRINQAINERNIVIGGTSAGMAILGTHYFTAQNGTVTSIEALNNPFHNRITLDSTPFLNVPFLNDVITDTHYDNPDRRGRHSVFLARFLFDYGQTVRGIACDEYTAICIDNQGIARVFGEYPSYDDNAYFIQINCEIENMTPEVFAANQPVTWVKENKAIKVLQIKGTMTGSNSIDLNTWQSTDGTYYHWFIENGSLIQEDGTEANCIHLSLNYEKTAPIILSPNPFVDVFEILLPCHEIQVEVQLMNALGQISNDIRVEKTGDSLHIISHNLKSGVYVLVVTDSLGRVSKHRIVKQ